MKTLSLPAHIVFHVAIFYGYAKVYLTILMWMDI